MVFRGNAGLPDPPAPEQVDPTQKVEEKEKGEEIDTNLEMKHSYVVQARFDLCAFPECIDKNEENERLKWVLKVYS